MQTQDSQSWPRRAVRLLLLLGAASLALASLVSLNSWLVAPASWLVFLLHGWLEAVGGLLALLLGVVAGILLRRPGLPRQRAWWAVGVAAVVASFLFWAVDSSPVWDDLVVIENEYAAELERGAELPVPQVRGYYIWTFVQAMPFGLWAGLTAMWAWLAPARGK